MSAMTTENTSDSRVYVGWLCADVTRKSPSERNPWWRIGKSPLSKKSDEVDLYRPRLRFRRERGGELDKLPNEFLHSDYRTEMVEWEWEKRVRLCRIVRKMLRSNLKDANERAELAAALPLFGADVLSMIGSYIDPKPCYNRGLLYAQYCRLTQ